MNETKTLDAHAHPMAKLCNERGNAEKSVTGDQCR